MQCSGHCRRNAVFCILFFRQSSGLCPSCFAAHLDSDSVNKVTVPSAHTDRAKS